MIAWYVHHHGHGHLHRARAVAAVLDEPVVGLSSLPRPPDWPGEWVRLPGDNNTDEPVDPTAHGVLHWVPLGHSGLRARMHAISTVLARPDVRLLVADVSVEVALLARLHGVAVAVIAQRGDRGDRPHRSAYDLATIVIAPWPPSPGDVPDWERAAVHVGAVSRFDGHPPATDGPAPDVVLIWGGGGTDVDDEQVRSAASATPDRHWTVLGRGDPNIGGLDDVGDPPNLHRAGWCDDVWPVLSRATVVVTHGGQNAVAEVAAARRPAVVVPQRRPHDEQVATGRALAEAGIAVVAPTWPDADRWPGVLVEAETLGGDRWARWSFGDGAHRVAAALHSVPVAGGIG